MIAVKLRGLGLSAVSACLKSVMKQHRTLQFSFYFEDFIYSISSFESFR